MDLLKLTSLLVIFKA